MPNNRPLPSALSLTEADALLDAAPVALLHVAIDGTVQRLNAAARALLGDLLQPGQALAGLWAHGADAAALLGAGPAQLELPLQRGSAAAVRASSQPVAQGGWMLSLQPLAESSAAVSQLALAVELGRIGMWRIDLAQRRLYANREAWQVLGQAPRPEGMSVEELRSLLHPDDLPHMQASADHTLASGEPTMAEARYRRSDGSWRHVLMRRAVQRGPDGTPHTLLGVGMDITDNREQRHRAEDMARRFELVTRTAGIGYWMMEDGAERAIWSEQMRRMFGLPASEPVPLLADWLQQCVHPADRSAVHKAFGDWARGGYVNVDLAFRALRPDGSVRHLMSHSRVERSSSAEQTRPLLFGVLIDLTDRRSAESALRSAAERAALAARGAGLGTWEQDLETGEAFWDSQMWALRGLPPQPRAASAEERMASVHPDDRERTARFMRERMAHSSAFEFEFRVVWPDGRVRWLASRSLELFDDHSGAKRRIGVNWDVTDKRSAEAARQEREIALRESQAKSKFLARMSHELRTPLNAVLGFAQLLLVEELGTDGASAARRRRLEHIRSAGQHLLTLINDVLDLSSLEGGELRIALQPVALAPLVEQTLPLLGPLLDGYRDNRGVNVHTGALQGHVMADVTRLRQVLLNLLSNAVKYNREGGQVTVEALPRGEWVLLRISDSGRGMSESQLMHLFEPFNRLGLQMEGSGAIEGTGIGLAIVKALVERMGGSIHVDSQVGVGTVFELRLAAAPGPADTAGNIGETAAEAATAAPAPRRHQVLYVEDNPVNALIIGELLGRRSDLTLHVAVDGSSGVAQAAALLPDLILLDMQLPDFDGFEVLRRLRAVPATAGIPVIAVSANAMPDDIERALRAGMADYWTKPLDFKAFMAAMDSFFGQAPA
jgi:PAS domain S-box-containing protein